MGVQHAAHQHKKAINVGKHKIIKVPKNVDFLWQFL